MNICFYGNGSSENHGCEAIVRGTVELLGTEFNVFRIQAENPIEDIKYGLGDLALISPAKAGRKKNLQFISAYLKLKLHGSYTEMDGLRYLDGIDSACAESDIALSVGGDNYCYQNTGIYAYLNKEYNKRGIKTILWGCSIEPSVVPQIKEDLNRYKLVVARESITYNAVKAVQKNTILAPDPAFFMKAKECALDDRLKSGDIIGINVSPMILANEKTPGMAYDNFKGLIQHILSETNAIIALIPHVVWSSNDDRTVLRRLSAEFNDNPRIVLVDDHTAPELKYIISKCRFFVGARTHATIAAYSSCVPTIVVGYSVKAEGIAKDLFGTDENYVIPVQKMSDENQLTEGFIWLENHEDEIRSHLQSVLPDYCRLAEDAINKVLSM